MILPAEIDRLRSTAQGEADGLIDTARARTLILARAPAGSYSSDVASLISYRFNSGDLIRGDLLRGELFGWYSSDTGGAKTEPRFRLTFGANTVCSVAPNKNDLAGDIVAFHLTFAVRLAGGEGKTINSPPLSPDTQVYGYINVRWGDQTASVDSFSRFVDAANMLLTTTNFAAAPAVNLGLPASVTMQYEPDVITDVLSIYGGYMEGL